MKLKLISAAICVLLGAACAQAPAIEPIATIKDLHDAMINPASDAIFAAGGEPPKDAEAWAAVRNNAIVLAESGSMMMVGSRAKDAGQWMQMSQAMVDAAALAVKAADAGDVDLLIEAGNQLVPACERCHRPYRDGGRMMGGPAQ
jgi:cytochrome c556